MPPGTLLHCARNAAVAGVPGRCAMAQTGGVTRLRARSVVRQGHGDHEIWCSPKTHRNFPVDSKIKSRHTANGVLKQAGLEKAF